MSGSVETCPRCGYSWTYNGKLEYRRTCPNCGYVWYKKREERKDGI